MKIALVGGPRAGLTFEPVGEIPNEIVMLSEEPVLAELMAEITGVDELVTVTYQRYRYDPALDEMIFRYVEGRNGESGQYGE